MNSKEDLIIKYFNECRESGFPFYCYSEDILKEDFNKLMKSDRINNFGLKIVYQYHNSVWESNKKGRLSPLDAWYDDDKLIQVIDNRLKYIGDDLSVEDILRGFSVSYIAPKVSVFRPTLAKYIINKYLQDYNEIFDPCSGFSGRMLGAYSCGKKYIGQDINKRIVGESNKIITDFKLDGCEVSQHNSLATKGNYECLFTCSPYGDKENWNQSIEELSCDEWIDICLKNYKCKEYIFVVDDTEKYKDFIVEEIINKSHFAKNTEKIIKLTQFN